jgi:hypothetical protein
LLDLLFRCERLGLKVNLSLRPGTPMDFRRDEMLALIGHYRMPENDTIFAYDLAWEPSHYDHAYQERTYGKLWSEWVRRRHASREAAEKAWGAAGPWATNALPGGVAAGAGTPDLEVPSMKQLTQDGPWRGLVADYRTFLDGLVEQRYAAARSLVRASDPNHPVSFRMQHAGDPTFNGDWMLPYDFAGLAKAVDIWEPEAYGRIGDWEQVKGGHFTAAYARLCDPGKPLIWAEMGYNCWEPAHREPDAGKLAFAARFYRDFYRLLRESGASGVFYWWYPGGYRLNENSDFGIVNPDGTDRPVTRAIREEGEAFLAAPPPAARSDHWIGIDRDRDARGLYGVYQAVQGEYWDAVGKGRQVSLRWIRPPVKR